MKRPNATFISLALFGLLAACLPSVVVSDAAVVTCDGPNDCPGEFICVEASARCVGVTACVDAENGSGTPINEGEVCQTLAGTEGVCLVGRCKVAVCGDGEIDVSIAEECDAGESNSDTEANACRRNCAKAYCGDGVVDTGEACDQSPVTEGGAQCASGCYFQCPMGTADFGATGTCDAALDLADTCIGRSTLLRAGSDAYATCIFDVVRIRPDGTVLEIFDVGQTPEAFVASDTLLVVGGYESLDVLRLSSQQWESFVLPEYATASVAATLEDKIWFGGLNDELFEFDLETGEATIIELIDREKTHISLSADNTELLVGTAGGELYVFDIETRDLTLLTTVTRGIAGAFLTQDDVYWLDAFGAKLWKQSRIDGTVTAVATAHGIGIRMKRVGDTLYFLAGTPQDAHLFAVPLTDDVVIPRAIASLAVPSDFAVLDSAIVIGDENLLETLDPSNPYSGGFFILPRGAN